MERILIYSCVVYAVVGVGMFLIQRFDHFSWEITGRGKYILLILSGISGVLLWRISAFGNIRFTRKEMLFLAMFAGCLLFACITDSKRCVVFQFTWWMAAVVLGIWFVEKIAQNDGIIRIIERDNPVTLKLCELLVYILLQEYFFSRMYGKADCHGFALCAVAEYLCGINMSGYVYHMAIAFGMLGAVQLVKGNVNCKGNLKCSVPFLPYITVSFWVLLYIAFFFK